MKRVIAGVSRDKRNRGDVIELVPEKKALLAVKDGLANHDRWHKEWKGKLAFGTKIEFEDLKFSKKGNPLKKKWANNTYNGRGTVKVHLRNMESNKLLEPKSMQFKINFSDSLDTNGIPDLSIDNFQILSI